MGADKTAPDFRFPAEFEKHEAIWLGWPVDEAKKGLSAVPVYVEIIEALVSTVKVRIAAQHEEEKREILTLLEEKGVSIEKVEIFCIPHNDIWFRDMGPIFLVNGNGEMCVQKFGFNAWGYEAPNAPGIILDRMVPDLVAEARGLDLRDAKMISEGGDREFNGKGTMITSEAVEFQRNPGKSRDELEREFKKIFNLEKVIWLKKGLYEDDLPFNGLLPGPDGVRDVMTCFATGGHIDEYCRFVSEDVVLVCEVTEEEAGADPIARVNRERLEENVAILRNAVDQDGKPLEIERIPTPAPLFCTMRKGDGVYDAYCEKYGDGFIYPLGDSIKVVAASSYNNFLITNGAVLAPCYWRPGLPEVMEVKDRQAREVLAKLFPDRKIHTLDARALNFGGGGIHCITQQEPFVV